MALNKEQIKRKYCSKTGLKRGGYNSALLFMKDLMKIEAFGSIENYEQYCADYYNKLRHEKESRERHDEFGMNKLDYWYGMLDLFVEHFFPGPNGRAEYNSLRDKAAKRAYYERSKANGKNAARIKANRERRHNDPEYREHLRRKQREIIAKDPERQRQYKLKWKNKQGPERLKERATNNYFKRTYGDAWEIAKATHLLEKEVKSKRGEHENQRQIQN